MGGPRVVRVKGVWGGGVQRTVWGQGGGGVKGWWGSRRWGSRGWWESGVVGVNALLSMPLGFKGSHIVIGCSNYELAISLIEYLIETKNIFLIT